MTTSTQQIPGRLWVAAALLAATVGCTQLEERTSIQGQVCLRACATDSFLAGVQVELQLAGEPDAPDRPIAVTDGAGQFIFFNVSSTARYRLVVQSEAYLCPPREELIEPDQDDLQAIDLLCDTNLSALLSAPGDDACGQDLPNAEVVATDLRGVNLTGANLTNADLSHSDLSGATLTGANLTNARLLQTTLRDAHLADRAIGCEVRDDGQPTRLIGAQLSGADLQGADLAGAVFTNADLTTCDLRGSDLSGADLSGANLRGSHPSALKGCPARLPDPWRCLTLPSGLHALAGPEVILRDVAMAGLHLDGVTLSGADLSGADLSGASLVGADLSGADLSEASLTGVRAHGLRGCPSQLPRGWRCVAQPELTTDPDAPGTPGGRFALVGPGAQLQRVNLSGADLFGVNLEGADLSEADLRQSDMTRADIARANLHGARPHRLQGCPAANLMNPWRCVPDDERQEFALIGPGLNLSGADLSGADLSGADLSGADLANASFTGANLTQVDFTGAELTSAGMYRANLYGADLTDAQLLGGLRAAQMAGCPAQLPEPWRCVAQPDRQFALIGPEASLSGLVNLSGADLRDAVLVRASLGYADLSGADLIGADLTDARVAGTDVSGTAMHGLRGCPRGGDLAQGEGPAAFFLDEERVACLNTLNLRDLSEGLSWSCVLQPATGRVAFVGPGVHLVGADLSGAHLPEEALIVGADLSDADLSGADLSAAQARCARWDNTLCPDGVNSDDTEDGTCDAHMTP